MHLLITYASCTTLQSVIPAQCKTCIRLHARVCLYSFLHNAWSPTCSSLFSIQRIILKERAEGPLLLRSTRNSRPSQTPVSSDSCVRTARISAQFRPSGHPFHTVSGPRNASCIEAAGRALANALKTPHTHEKNANCRKIGGSTR